jgi:hypothetical protein
MKQSNQPSKLEALIARVEQTERPEWAKTAIDVSAAITPPVVAICRIVLIAQIASMIVSLLKP